MKNNAPLCQFLEENRKKLFLYLLKLTGEQADAEDIFQDAVIRYAEKYPDTISLPLLFTVAKNAFTDSKRHSRQTQDITETELPSGGTPETEAISRDGEKRIMAALNRLDAEDREILAMAGQDGLSYAEIGRLTRLSEANVKVRIHRARKKLKNILEEMNG